MVAGRTNDTHTAALELGGHEGEDIPVMVYTNGDCAELFLNGDSMGIRCKDPKSAKSTERYRLLWDKVPYAPGSVKAVAYKEGVVIGEKMIWTAGIATKLKLTTDRKLIHANGDDLAYIMVEALDADGNLCPLADNLITFSVGGPAQIEAVGNGDPQSLEPFIANQRKLFFGKAMLIIRSHDALSGEIVIRASSADIKESMIIIQSK